MLLEQERRDVCRAGRRMVAGRLAAGTAGDLSVRVGDLIVVTPADVRLDQVEPGDCPVLSLDGRIVEGLCEPGPETGLHLRLHHDLGPRDVGAVVHIQSEFAAAVAAAIDELPPIHYRALRLGGAVPVAPYATYGTPELASGVRDALHKGGRAALLASHGGVAVGESLDAALENAELLEWLCSVYVRGRALGEPRVLTEEEMHEISQRDRYGWAGPEL